MLQQHEDFNVFQLMRLMVRDTDKRLPIGRRLRFHADLSAAFPAREFASVKLLPYGTDDDFVADTPEQRFEISTANFCVASVTGPLPEPFTEWARELSALRATAMADFFDIFNQRANVLRYQLKQELTPSLDDQPPAQTEMAQRLAALVGLGDVKLANQVPLPKRAWLGIAGLLANQRKQASTLEHVLGIALGASARLTENVGAWHELDGRDRCALGRRNHSLGQTCVVGRRVWDQQARVRLEIGVLDYKTMCQLLPPARGIRAAAMPQDSIGTPQPGYAMLRGLVKLLVNCLADVEIVLHVADSSVPPTPLPQPAHYTDSGAMRLGQSAWLAGTPVHRHATRPVSFLIKTRHPGEFA
ncbi:hypothetical protein WM40_24010 [Robbsia andropogonis]|uniref:Type VI secretion protein n=2 Tax=Robbsia andropogonis TaxID=28092 RepID=A0A0F5JTX4_9BURK|nr:hypothetical protein WM40_24010 [Robbsia andropogonis]